MWAPHNATAYTCDFAGRKAPKSRADFTPASIMPDCDIVTVESIFDRSLRTKADFLGLRATKRHASLDAELNVRFCEKGLRRRGEISHRREA